MISAKSVVFCVKIGKISAIFQPKAMIPSSKNQIFQKFLTHFPKTSYELRATRNGYIFVSNVQLRLIIEGVFFYSLSLPPVCAYLLFCRGQKEANYLRAYKAQPAQKARTINLEAKRKPLRGMNLEL